MVYGCHTLQGSPVIIFAIGIICKTNPTRKPSTWNWIALYQSHGLCFHLPELPSNYLRMILAVFSESQEPSPIFWRPIPLQSLCSRKEHKARNQNHKYDWGDKIAPYLFERKEMSKYNIGDPNRNNISIKITPTMIFDWESEFRRRRFRWWYIQTGSNAWNSCITPNLNSPTLTFSILARHRTT